MSGWLFQIFLFAVILAATICAGLGEMVLKMAGDWTKSYWGALVHPVMLYRLVVFFTENLLLLYAYKKGMPFIAVGILQAVCYAVTVSIISWKVFHEQVEFQQILGVTCCLVGVFLLMTSRKGSVSIDALADSLFR